MSEKIEIPLEEYRCLRRHLSEALEIFQGLEVREISSIKTPEPSPQEKRIQRYGKILVTGQRGKKPAHLKKKNRP